MNLTAYAYFFTASPGGPPYRMLVDSGIPVGLSSDGMQIAPMNPWIHAYYATTGRNALGTQVNPGQQLTREEVLEHFTRANRWFLGGQDEDLLGVAGGRQARRRRRAERRLLRGRRRGSEEPALGTDCPRRTGRAQRRGQVLGITP